MKRDGRTLDHGALEIIRLMAVERVRDGAALSVVIGAHGFSRTTIYRWFKAAAKPGIGLGAPQARPAAGRPCSLTARQERQVFGWVNGKEPRQHGLDFGLWMRSVVADLIERKFGIRLGLAAVGAGLTKLGLTPQKPLQDAGQRDPEAIERWRREACPAIARQEKADNGEVFFWDRSGFRADAAQGQIWGVRSRTPVVERPGQRQSISAASAVNAKGGFWCCIYESGLTAALFVSLPGKIMRCRTKPAHLVVDGLPTHRTKLLKDCARLTRGRLTPHILPSHAPELNPDEAIWSHRKRTGVACAWLRKDKRPCDKIKELLAAIKAAPKLVRSFFRAPSVAYVTN